MNAERGFRCADAARDRGDAIAGTAPRGTYWVLIEHRGGWPVNGFDGLDIDRRIRSEVYSAAQALRARILLIRRPGRRTRQGPGVWGVMHLGDSGRMHQIWGRWDVEADLLEICDALGRCGERSRRTDNDSSDEAGAPIILVCAHGLHDLCCAVRGRPVAAALREQWPELVWECSHVGGDRFAANVLVVPDGVYYGNLDEESAPKVIADHLQGSIGPDFLRGFTDLKPVEQIAVIEALRRNGPAARFDYTVTVTTVDRGVWTVAVKGNGLDQPGLEVDIDATRKEPAFLTCRGTQKAAATAFSVIDVRPVTSDRVDG